ncbi:glycoside hydrolase family 43 [Zalerion maritima]|uniref:Arabinan endo-1,5-alpha-L-arabinosidase n=1 Tax=Zalerion maritima TaxID=339359 RepID=A0AAD5WS24_9PEZI|nr:glycoside hydrolase family 43 [Zalerion maritima]
MKFLRSLVAAGSLITSAMGYANPGSCSGQCWSHDPSVIQRSSDGTYFRFETGSLIGIWKASSLTGSWVYQGAVVPSGSSINLDGSDDLWAPDVHQVGNTYILYYSVSTFGSQNSAIGYATSSTMEYGSWTDHGSTGIRSSSSKNYNAIDANLIEAGGSYYMNFGSFWGDIYQVAMNSAATSTAGSASYQIAYNNSGSHAVEGSYMYEHGGYYYLFFSNGICCGYDSSMPAQGEEYHVSVCRSAYATGGFVDANGNDCLNGGGTTVLASHGNVYGPGGQGVFSDPTYGDVLYYHYADTTVGYADSQYLFGWNTITWSNGWPTV